MHNQPSTHETTDRFKAALEMLGLGDEAGAEKLCSQIDSGHPDHAAALHLMGVLAYRRNDFELAQNALLHAVAEKPSSAAYQNDLGLVYLGRQEHALALKYFTRAAALDAGLTAAHNNGGLALLAMKQPEEALKWFKRALSLDPKFAHARLNSGLAYRDQNDTEAARDAFKSALAINPDNAKAHFFLGDLSQSKQNLQDAIGHFQEAIRVKPDYLAAYNRLAVCLAESARLDEAISWLSLATHKAPQSAETFCNYGNMLRKARYFQQAAQMYRQAIELKPEWAEAHFNLALIHLLLENFEEGWPEFDWRLRQFPPESGYPNRHGLPLWQGEPLAGKTILVYDEQGFGDVFLFLRYLPKLKKAGAHVVLETRPALMKIFKSWTHIDELVVRQISALPKTACDYCIPLASLPGRLGTPFATIPAEVPYLHADPGLKALWALRMTKGAFKIGIVWSGSNIDPSRNLDLALLTPLAEVKEIALYGLQKPSAAEVSRTVTDCPWMDNLGPELHDFSDTAAVIANCDLIIAIDTAVAHLAGAMAAPTWVLLPYVADWRWFLDRSDSPWYPTMRLFRQDQPGQWTLPVCQVLVELKQLVAGKLTPLSSQTTPKVVNRKTAEAFYYQAQALQKNDRTDEAVVDYGKAIEADPALMEAHYNLGVLHYQQNRWTEAADCFQAALVVAPDFVHAAYNLAAAYDKRNLRSAAIAAYRQTLAIESTFASAAYNLGLLLFDDGHHANAAEAFRQAVTSDPNHYQAYNNLGLACHHAGWLNKAIESFEGAIRIKPDFVQAYHNLGNVYMDCDQWDRTIHYYRKALDYNYQDPIAHHEMGKLYMETLDFDNARLHLEKAVALQPDNAEANCDLAHSCLMQEDYLEGWRHLRWRFKCTDSHIRIYPYQFNLPSWDGAHFENRTLLVHCEQGFGDTIQFARFIPLVKSLGGQVLLQVQPALQPLFHGFPGIDRLLTLTEQPPNASSADMVVPLMSIPERLRIVAAQIPSQVPYFRADAIKTKQWKTAIDPNSFNVGIVWSGNPMHVNDARRNCPLDDMLSLSTLPGLQLHSLQKKLEPSETAHLIQCGAAIHMGDMLETFGDTAAIITNMDLIISVDTAVAHLAGALGCPVWILLSHLPDWRWGLCRTDSIWYPTARLFRQPQKGAWKPVFAMVREALAEILASSRVARIDTMQSFI